MYSRKKPKNLLFQKYQKRWHFGERLQSKVLPIKFREGKKEYFGKKGMSLHIDVFFTKQNGNIRKWVYYSSVYRCDQGIAGTLSLASTVLDKLKDRPNIRDIYAKSDNTSSYHGNFVLEALHKLCLSKNINLKRYDYNEPTHKKDQCDRESAGAKS